MNTNQMARVIGVAAWTMVAAAGVYNDHYGMAAVGGLIACFFAWRFVCEP